MTVQVITESTTTCPVCGTSKTETMPTDACQFFYGIMEQRPPIFPRHTVADLPQ